MKYEDEEDSHKPPTPDDFHSEKKQELIFGVLSGVMVNGLINGTLLDESSPGKKRLTALDEMIIFAFKLSPRNDKLRKAIKTLVLEKYYDILFEGYADWVVAMFNEETKEESFEAIPEKDEEPLDEGVMIEVKDLALGLYSGYYSTDVIDSNGLNHLQQIIHSYYSFDRDKWEKIGAVVYQEYLNLKGGSYISG